ncbi:TonB-dependent receptor plug domain-containing protein [Hymenobacter ruricola]|uniref:TonB-dependent receptor n=1 Tax=Hymenobacter ruricola TaxID=2791023 RepID=A0ABS0I9P4_9BACT|nr:TonB-dependent receptor [Hymenobacter ruricola]MBF9223654.1 TonB-dependent receptor [Hymenobacter ruricola]
MHRFSLVSALLGGGLLLGVGSGAARAQQLPGAAPPDSARLARRAHRLAEVRVRAVGREQFAVGSSRLALDSATLSQFRGGTVAEALAARTPLYLKSYGPGQLATPTLRGTSAQHTAVLWNGLNIMLPTLGQNDFALLPLSANTQLAVQLGPAAALYGSGAVGGAVLLTTAPDWRPGPRASLQADAGSFGLRGGSFEASAASAAVAMRVAASYRQAQNNYTYLRPEFGGPVRYTLTSAALRHQWSVAPEVAWRLSGAGQLTATAWLTDADRDIQPAVGTTDRHARERDQSRRLVLAYQHQASARTQWTVRGAWFEDVLNYRDDGQDSRSRVRTTQAQAEYTAALGARATLRVGAEAQHFSAAVAEYGRPNATENRAAAFALLRFDPVPRLRLSANLRQAVLPQANPLTPTAGLEWDVWAPAATADTLAPARASRLTFRASAARSYRAPTLNERYWQVGGNPNLRPETGLGYEAGLTLRSQPTRHLALEHALTGYRQLVDDWVQWAPGLDGLWSPRNLRQVLTQGLEASSRATWQRGRHRFSARLAYAYTWAHTHRATPADPVPAGLPLPYVPAHTAAGTLDYGRGPWRAAAQATFTSYRYTDAGGVAFLPGYGLLGGGLGYALALPGRVEALLQVQGTNLLNRAYDSYEGRPAPPRAALLSLRLSWR